MTILGSAVRTSRLPLGRVKGANNEGFVLLAIILLCVVVGSVDTKFWSLGTAFNVLRNSYEDIVFALGFLLILLIGGIDVSFDAIGIFAGYSVAVLGAHGFTGNLALTFAVAAGIGLCLGLVNAIAVGLLKLPVLIVTLGTRGIFVGVLLTYIGSNYVNSLPGSLGNFANLNLLRVNTTGHQSVGLHALIIPLALLCLLVAAVLRYTMFGRGVYALGAGEELARRAGFPVPRIKVVVFCTAGVLAGLAGMIHVSLIGYGDPQDLVGGELDIIAAVVLGGASIFGGRGSVLGTVLGVLLISLINYSLILLGIPSAWQNVAVGVLLLLGVILQIVGRRPPSANRLRTGRDRP